MNGENVKNNDFIVSSDYGSIKHRWGKFIRNALGDINKLTVKVFANVSDLNLCYFLETSLTSSLERLFFSKLYQIMKKITTLFVMVHIQNLVPTVYVGLFIIYRKM